MNCWASIWGTDHRETANTQPTCDHSAPIRLAVMLALALPCHMQSTAQHNNITDGQERAGPGVHCALRVEQEVSLG